MAAHTDDNGNGKVTMAVLGSKLDTVSDQLSTLIRKFDDHLVEASVRNQRISLIEQRNTGADEKLKEFDRTFSEHEKRMDGIAVRSNVWDGLNTIIATGVGAFLLWLKGH